MRPTVETWSLGSEIALAFRRWTVWAMTTAEANTPVSPGEGTEHNSTAAAGTAMRRRRLLGAAGLTAVLLGSQSLAASSSQASAVRFMLPSEGLLAGLGDGLRRGYGLAMEQTRSCGFRPPSTQLGWLAPGSDPSEALARGPRPSLLIAPPAASLPALGLLADQQRLSVLLPLQRGASLEGLPQLRGSDRIWPLMPGRSLEADRLAEGLLADGLKRVMVVQDRSAEARAMAGRFMASFSNGSGQVIGPTSEAIAVDGRKPAELQQLVTDVDWYRPQALVVFSRPGSPLATGVQRASWPEPLVIGWPFPIQQPMPQAQIGVNPIGRGPGWAGFEQRFQKRWGYRPGVVESAGYDTGLMAALASVQRGGQAGWDLQWFSSQAKPQPLCTALMLRAKGAKLRPEGAGSRLDLSAAVPPTTALNLSRAAARQ